MELIIELLRIYRLIWPREKKYSSNMKEKIRPSKPISSKNLIKERIILRKYP